MTSLNSSHTCDINIDGGECRQRNCSHVLCSYPQQKALCCFIIQWLSYQDWSRTIMSVWSQVETNWHVGLWDKPLFQVVSDTGISKGRSCFDCLHSSKSLCNQPLCKYSISKSYCVLILPDTQLQNTKLLQKFTVFKQINNVQLLCSLRPTDRQTTLPELRHPVSYSLE